MPLLSFTFLAFVPFLWLAFIRRRAREWAVLAVYLAAETTLLVLKITNASADTFDFELLAGMLLIPPIHAVLAFNPTAGASSWREARAARDRAGLDRQRNMLTQLAEWALLGLLRKTGPGRYALRNATPVRRAGVYQKGKSTADRRFKMSASFWQIWLRHRKSREDGPDRIVSTVVGLVFVVLFVTVIVVLVWERLHR